MSKQYFDRNGILPMILILVSGLLLYACSQDEKSVFSESSTQSTNFSNNKFTKILSSTSGIDFINKVNEDPNRGLNFYDYFYNGSGVAIGDVNNDQLPDIFFTGNDVPNRLYINKGNFKFEDVSKKAGIQTQNWSTGVTMVDINKDGWLDIYVCNSGPYEDRNSTKNQLYINNKNNTFTEQGEQYGVADHGRSTQAAFFDMDKDGDLDLWVMNHALRNRERGIAQWLRTAKTLPAQQLARQSSALYRNDGNGKFTNISKAAGIQKIGFGLGLAVRDFDEDGLLDVYVANDYFIPDFMWKNNGDGTFNDIIKQKITHTSYYSMGCDAADINNDGLSDMMVVDMTPADHVRNKVLMASMDVESFDFLTKRQQFTPQYMFNSLYVNQGFGIMSDIGLFAGVSQTDWSWAPLLVDLDNDGYKDLFVTNGYRKDTKNNDWKNSLAKIRQEKGMAYSNEDYFEQLKKVDVNPVPNQVYKNINGLNFETMTTQWGFDTPSFSNGAAYADLDNDGDLDLVVNNFDQEAFLYRNNASANSNFIRFKLKNGATSNSVMHSKICIYYQSSQQCNDFVVTRGYQSAVEPIAHFGLGKTNKIDRVEIEWTDGTTSTIANPAVNKVHEVDQQKTTQKPKPIRQLKTEFATINHLVPDFFHNENSYDDFQKEVLLPHRQSMLGPALCVGDVNGDQLEDFFVGGAKDQAGAIYIQATNGKFYEQDIAAITADKAHEDCGAQFMDIDKDGDFDLYVASGGGGEFEGKNKMLQDRLYINNGMGKFSRAKAKLPIIKSSTQAIATTDWDKDGDLDIFVGGRTTPGKYPTSPTSYLLINNNGTFTDETEKLAPNLNNIGMVTGAEWSDVDKDGFQDLILVGEWMPITIFKNKNGQQLNNNTPANLKDNTKGWWASLSKYDFDKDGDDDFIAGNIGLNNKFHPSKEKPLYVYANDFDKNGSLDIVLSKIYKNKQVPVRGKECSSTQMPFISEKYPTYTGFAEASLEDIYSETELDKAVNFEVNNFASLYIENKGNGQFEYKELPTEAQLAPINGMVIKDFDRDGIVDVIIGGSVRQTEVETPLYDAGKGLLLKGIGNGNFETDLRVASTGIFFGADVKNLELIHLGPQSIPSFLVANNNSKVEFVIQKPK